MRTLKFRVYIPEHEKFSYFELGNFDYSDRYLHQNDYPVQQFTGLKDSKGVDVYEGDLIEYNSDLLQVKFENSPTGSSFVLVPVDSEDLGYSLTTYSSDYRVVGNIFEKN